MPFEKKIVKENFISVISDYLKCKETGYALLINGEWGSGKTHFILNEIKSDIEKIDSPLSKDGDVKKYKQIYVSLYGVSSIDEIKDVVFYALNSNYKWVETLTSKTILAVSAIPFVGNSIRDVLSPNKKEKEAIRNSICEFKDKVLIFDDLERIDTKKIDIQTVLGYINHLSEHKNYKIIVVANDEKLTDGYKEFKEKTIRFSYKFEPNLSKVFDSVILRYPGDYQLFLAKKKFEILRVFTAGNCKNIRTLLFVTDVFQKVFMIVNGKYRDEINSDLLQPFLIISIEAKAGFSKEILIDSLPHILSISVLLNQDFDLNPSKSNEQSYQKSEKEKYEIRIKKQYEEFSNGLSFYPELFDLIFDGYFSTNAFEQVVDIIRKNYVGKEETKEIKLAKRIIDWTQIPDDDFSDVINNINMAVSHDKYGVFDLLRIYASFIQIEFMHIDCFCVSEDLTNTFKAAIDKAMSSMQYMPFFDMQATMWDGYDTSYAKDKYNELRTYAIRINQRHKNEYNLKQKEEFLIMIRNNDAENFQKFFSDLNNKFLLIDIDTNEVVNAVISANSEIKRTFNYGLSSFFIENLTNPTHEDVDYLISMKSALDSYLNKQISRKVSMSQLLFAQTYIDKVLKKYKTILSM